MAGSVEDAVAAGRAAATRTPSKRRVGLVAVAGAFWGWLAVRWLYDWVVAPGVNVRARDPFLPSAPFESVARGLATTTTGVGALDGLLDWLAGSLDFLGFAVEAMPAMASGVWLTIVLTVAGILLGLVLAVPLSVGRVYGNRFTRWVSLAYTELVRGTPLLAQLFFIYYVPASQGLIEQFPLVGADPFPDLAVWAAIVGFTLNSAAYQSEYIRSALLSVDTGQLTAARSVGLSKLGGIRHVVLPQGLRYAIPGWSNELVYLIKYSSLATFITVTELFGYADKIVSETYLVIYGYTLAALFYLALVLSASAVMSWLEDRVAVPGVGGRGTRNS